MESNVCPICQFEIDYYAVGKCNHPICLRCAIKLRRFSNPDGSIGCCPTCRTQNASNRISKACKNWDDFDLTRLIKEPTLNLDFEDDCVAEAFKKLMACVCPVCSEEKPSMSTLNTHTTQKHNLSYCDLCLRHARLLPSEFKLMTSEEHAAHVKWDAVTRRGHPVCKFCHESFYEFEDLLTHIRDKYFLCGFCYQDRIFEVFQRQHELFQHYKSAHHVCPDCEARNIMTCFATAEQLNAHRSYNHSNEARDDPNLWQPVQILYSTEGLISQHPRHRGRRNQQSQNETYDVVYHPQPPNPEEWTGADFPTLTGDTTTQTSSAATAANGNQQTRLTASVTARAPRSHAAVVRGISGAFLSNNQEDFPSLPTVTSSSSNGSNAQAPPKPSWVGASKKPPGGASSSSVTQRNFQQVPTAADFPSLLTAASSTPHTSVKWGDDAQKASTVTKPKEKQQNQRKPTAADFPALGSSSGSSILHAPRLEPFVPPAQQAASSNVKGKKKKLNPTEPLPASDLQHFSSALAKARKSSWWDAADNDGAVERLLSDNKSEDMAQSLSRVQIVDSLEGRDGVATPKSNTASRPVTFSADDFPKLVAGSSKETDRDANDKKLAVKNAKQGAAGTSKKNIDIKKSSKISANKPDHAAGKSKSNAAKQETLTDNEISETKKMENFPNLEDTETHLFKSSVYTPPLDFEEKNIAVIEKAKEILGGPGHSKNAFTQCIRLCGLYNDGSLSAQAYVQGLSSVISSSSDPDESEWFSRMIALLPNVGLQRALFRALKGEAAPKIPFANTPARCRGTTPPVWAKNVTSRLQICSKCEQVCLKTDMRDHTALAHA